MKTFHILLVALICSMAYGCDSEIEGEQNGLASFKNPLDTLARDTLYWFPDEHFPQNIDSLVRHTDRPEFYGMIPYKGKNFHALHFYEAYAASFGTPEKSLPTQIREQVLIGGVTVSIVAFEGNEYLFIRKSDLYPDLILWRRAENFFPIYENPEYPDCWDVGESVDNDSDLYKQLLKQKTSLLWSLY